MQMQQENDYIRIDLIKIADGLVRRIWVIVLSMILCGVIAFSYASFFITPLYESNVLLYVNNSSFSVGSTSFSISSSDISAAKSLVNTYLVILRTRMTLNEVIAVGDLNRTYSELRNMISASSVDNTEVFSVAVTSDNPKEAEHIANTIARVLPDKIADVVDGSSVRIVDYAVVPSAKKSPNVRQYTLSGLAIGLVLSCAAIVLLEIFDDQIRSDEYLIQNYQNIPLLSVIPDMLDTKSGKSYYYYSKASPSKKRNGPNAAGRDK